MVTGGAGYVGSHPVHWLVDEGHEVTVLVDDLSTGSAARLMTWFRRGAVRLVAGSILDADLVNRELAGAGTVFHLAAAAVPQAQGQVFNIGSATETSIGDLAEMIVAAAGSRSPIERTSCESVYGARFEDIPRWVPDISHAREVLGREPQVPLEDGLKRTIAWRGQQ